MVKRKKERRQFPESVVADLKKGRPAGKNPTKTHKAMLSFHGDRKYCSTFNSAVWSGKLALLAVRKCANW